MVRNRNEYRTWVTNNETIAIGDLQSNIEYYKYIVYIQLSGVCRQAEDGECVCQEDMEEFYEGFGPGVNLTRVRWNSCDDV